MKEVSESYLEKETATESRPLEIYDLWNDSGTFWRYTSFDQEISFEGNTYLPAEITRGAVEYDAKLDIAQITINAAFIRSPLLEFLAQNPIEPIWIKIRRLHARLANQASVVFIGQAKGVRIQGNVANMTGVGFEYHLTMPIPMMRYSPKCNYSIYQAIRNGRGCGVDRDSYKVQGTVTGSGLNWSMAALSGYSDGHFTRGWIEYQNEKRMIVSHVGAAIGIRYHLFSLSSGVTVTVYAGCDGNVTTCRDKFNNVVNFGGHPFIPTDNPALKY